MDSGPSDFKDTEFYLSKATNSRLEIFENIPDRLMSWDSAISFVLICQLGLIALHNSNASINNYYFIGWSMRLFAWLIKMDPVDKYI